jgi:glucose/arabinose dehydrogenase
MSLRYGFALALATIVMSAAADTADRLSEIELPPGFRISLVSDRVPGARQMALARSGTLFIGTIREGKVYVLPDANRDRRADSVLVLDEGLTMPSGVELIGSDLYVGALNRVLAYRGVGARKLPKTMPKPEIVTEVLPDKTHHGWKYLRKGPDGFLYVPVGAPCNVCLSYDQRFASILTMDPKNGETVLYASGIRNSVGIAFHPATKELWFSDNGRDMMGDDIPADEINHATGPGQHFGFPYIHAGDIPDPEFGVGRSLEGYVPPVVKIQAHSAALGITFYTGKMFPADYKHALFVAEHGSWNRSSKVGYRVSVIRFDADGVARYEPFATGWLANEDAWGRPNDVLVARDGSLLISDDQAGAIYRVTYKAPPKSRS